MKISELKGKHDHALTSWLKVIIFSLLMIAPLFASISQWIYVSFNKNAKDSYGGFNENQVEYVEPTNVETYQEYNLINHSYTLSTNGYIDLQILEVVNFTGNDTQKQLIEDSNRIYLRTTGDYYIFYNNSTYQYEMNVNNITIELKVIITATNINSLNDLKPILLERQVNGNETLDNAFYYGVEKMTESDLFNWTQNTTLYSGIKTMTDNLEIQTPAIAILLTYWFILTIIYVIIDIVLKGFTTLTHLIMGAK